MDGYLTINEIKEKYNISNTKLNEYRNLLKIEPKKENRKFYYLETDIIRLQEYIESQKPDTSGYLTAKEIKKKYNISDSYLKNYRSLLKMDYKKIGNVYYYLEADITRLQEYIKNNKPSPQDTAYGLVKFFYENSGNVCQNSARDLSMVGNLKTKGYTPNEIRTAMTLMWHKHYKNLNCLSTIIDEAIEEDKWWRERDIENTVGYIVKQFYKTLKITKLFNRNKFYFQCKIIERLLDAYTPQQLLTTINYMYKNNIKEFTFLESNIIKALDDEKARQAVSSNITQDAIKYAMQKVVTEQDIQKATKYFIDRTYYNTNLTRFEYAFLVNLQLNQTLLTLGIQDKKEHKWFFEIDFVNYNKADFLTYLKQQFIKNKADISQILF